MKGQTDQGMKEILQDPSLTPPPAIVWVVAKWKKETSFMIYYFGFFIGAVEITGIFINVCKECDILLILFLSLV